jgi:hypothetical protein
MQKLTLPNFVEPFEILQFYTQGLAQDLLDGFDPGHYYLVTPVVTNEKVTRIWHFGIKYDH